jgi:Domain of unknown function (DUF3482)
VLGGLVTGALAGLKADLATGGLTLGGGLLAGGVIGALSAAGLTRGYNLLRGAAQPTLTWTEEVLDDLVRSALLAYLAVAHYGRGRGDWTATEHPAFWSDEVEAVLAPRREWLQRLWALRQSSTDDTPTPQPPMAMQTALHTELDAFFQDAGRALLLRLYPDAQAALDDDAPLSASSAGASR